MANAKALKEAGNAAFRNGKFEEAVTCYTECMKADPSESTYPLNRSMAYLKMRKFAEAERDATKSLNLLPAGNTKALFRRATARKELGKFALAKEDLQAALKEDSTNATIKSELEMIEKMLSERSKSKVSKPVPPPPAATAPVASGQSKQKTTSTPTASSSPAQQDTQGGLSEQKRSALKAAITPDNQQNSTNGSDLLKPLSTRRLDTPASKIAQGTTSSAPTSSGTTATSSQGGAKPDFRTLRAKRDERQQNSSLRAVNGSNEASKREDTTFKIESEKTATSLSIPAVPSPKTIYEFERRWDDRKETLDRAALLQSLWRDRVNIPAMVGQNLSPELVDDIIDCLAKGLALYPNDLQSTTKHVFGQIPSCARFDFVVMLCGNSEVIKKLLSPVDPDARAILDKWGL